MQTFLPYADFTASSVALDDRRLGKQRVETFQILRALTWPEYAWKNHPAVRMWRGFVPALVAYGLANCAEWIRRGNADTVEASLLTFTGGRRPDVAELARAGQLPPWLGLPALHLSHRSSLLRKDPEFYAPLFGEIPDDLPYLWPPDAFPRWPARRRSDASPGLDAALDALGYATPRDGQAPAVAAVLEGRDVLGSFARGAGATSAALLAGLARHGPTLWVSTHAGGGGAVPPEGLTPPPPRIRVEAVSAASVSADSVSADSVSADSERTPTARPPSPVEVLAMATEADAVPDFRFHRPGDLTDEAVRSDLLRSDLALVVVDLGPTAPESSLAAEADAVRTLRAELGDPVPPLLVVGPEADAARRSGIIDRFGLGDPVLGDPVLGDPVLVGGGFDPARLRLGVVQVPDERRRRDELARLVAVGPRPGLLLAPDEAAVRRLAKGLTDRGGRVAPLLPAGRRHLVETAVAQWRRGSLAALVVPTDAALPAERLGRKDARFVHLAGMPEAPPGSVLRRLLDVLHQIPNRTAEPAVLLVVTDAEVAAGAVSEPGLAALLDGRSCRRAALLDVVGEPVRVPCDRCDVCLGVPAEALVQQGAPAS